MEREAPPSPRKLMDVLKADYPAASEVLISFPDQWEYIDTLQFAEHRLYIAGFPIERAFHGRDHFEGLPPEINVNLVFYRLYKFFQPWPMPQLVVQWNDRKGEGRVIGDRGFKLQLQPVGQAQAWFGLTHAVLWEAYFAESRRVANWKETLAEVWNVVEKDLDVPTIFTPPHEPTFPRGYREFLTGLGYAPDIEHPSWWSKSRREAKTRATVTPS